MTGFGLLMLLFLFQIKHVVADFVLQTEWMVRNKGRYGHPGGLAHAAIHAGLSALVLVTAPVGIVLASVLISGEFAIHYHIDWAKQHLVDERGLGQSQQSFWTLVGLDQFAHQVTYIAMALAVLAFV